MNDERLTPADHDLIEAARAIIFARHREHWHEIGAALRTADGVQYAAVHLEANVGRVAVCAEAIALGMAIAAGSGPIDTIVSVDARGTVVAPCGLCREMLNDYAPAARVLLPVNGLVQPVSVTVLLPLRSSTNHVRTVLTSDGSNND